MSTFRDAEWAWEHTEDPALFWPTCEGCGKPKDECECEREEKKDEEESEP